MEKIRQGYREILANLSRRSNLQASPWPNSTYNRTNGDKVVKVDDSAYPHGYGKGYVPTRYSEKLTPPTTQRSAEFFGSKETQRFQPLRRETITWNEANPYCNFSHSQTPFVVGAHVCIELDSAATRYTYDIDDGSVLDEIAFAENCDLTNTEDSFVNSWIGDPAVSLDHDAINVIDTPIHFCSNPVTEDILLATDDGVSYYSFCTSQVPESPFSSLSRESLEDLATLSYHDQSDSAIAAPRLVRTAGGSLESNEVNSLRRKLPSIPLTPFPGKSKPDDTIYDHKLEDMLDDMLSECIKKLPLSAWPLDPPELEPDLIVSLRLPVIEPLTLMRAKNSKATNARTNEITSILRDYAERESYSYRPLPPIGHDSADEIYWSPPPYPSPGPSRPLPYIPEALPPFPEHVTEIVDLVRLAAIILHRELFAALLVEDTQNQACPSSHYIRARLARLKRLVSSWPDKDFSAADGIEEFRVALSDGLILDRFVEHLFSSSLSSSGETKGKIQCFNKAYEELEPTAMSLKNLSDGDITLEDLAAYARAVNEIHVRLGTTSIYDDLSFPGIRRPTKTVTDLANKVTCSVGDSGISANAISKEVNPGYQQSPGLADLPEDEAALYNESVLPVLRDEEKFRGLLCQDDKSETQNFVDIVQHLLTFPQMDRSLQSELLCVLIRISTATGLYPRTLALSHDPQVNKEPVTCGAFGDILRGYVEEQCVCVKVVKIYRDESKSEKFLKSFMREVVVWGQLQHPNVLPFYGVYHLGNVKQRICLVSPWMENGTLVDYLRTSPLEVNKLLLVQDVALGLEYLHDRKIVHGDLKGANILVTLCGRACLADFGLASVNDTDVPLFSTLESTGHQGATPRYEAPELLDDCEGKLHRTSSSDMYAFGCVCYEVFTGKAPFYEISSPFTIITRVMDGETPTRPKKPSHETDQPTAQVTDEVWALMSPCWGRCPSDRPSAREILSRELFKDLVDSRPDEPQIWSSSKYGSALNKNPSTETKSGAASDCQLVPIPSGARRRLPAVPAGVSMFTRHASNRRTESEITEKFTVQCTATEWSLRTLAAVLAPLTRAY